MFDAYTVKKVLPRLVIAVIAIQLSWFIFSGMIFLTESVAYGMEALIYAPFGNASDFTFEAIFLSIPGSDIQQLFYSLIIGGAAVASFGGSIIIFALLALMALFVGVLTLLIRRILLILLLVMAPLALVAWILPNTERYWKMWWDNFSKLLLMFPIILVMIAAGRVMAKLGAEFGEESIATMMVLGGVFLPLVLIPKTFTMAGSAFNAIGGNIVNRAMGYGKQGAGIGRKRGAARWKDRGARAAGGNFFRGGNEDNWRGKVNRGMAGAANIKNAGLRPDKWRTNVRTALNTHADSAVEEFASKSHAFQSIKGDDAQLWAAKHTERGQIANELERRDAGRFAGENNRARREEAVSNIMRAQKEVGSETFQRARLRAQAKTGTGYQDADGNFNAAMMMRDVNDVYGNDRNGAGSALAAMRGDLAQSGQIAGQAGFSTWATQTDALYNDATTDIDAHNAIMDDTIGSVSAGNAVYGKPSSAAAVAEAHARRIREISDGIDAGTHTEDDLDAALAATAGLLDVMGTSASPQNASAFANQLMSVKLPPQRASDRPALVPLLNGDGKPVDLSGKELPPGSQPLMTRSQQKRTEISVRDLIDERMSNPEYRQRRKDYGSDAASAAAKAAAGAAPGGGTAAPQGYQPPRPGGP